MKDKDTCVGVEKLDLPRCMKDEDIYVGYGKLDPPSAGMES